jgi:hypothetical protein
MNTIACSLIEKKSKPNGETHDHLKIVESILVSQNSRTIVIEELITQDRYPVLLEILNQHLTTLLDCTGISPYEIWYFDQNKQFTGKAYCISDGKGSFQIQTQAKWALFVHGSCKTFDDLKHFNCTELITTDK